MAVRTIHRSQKLTQNQERPLKIYAESNFSPFAGRLAGDGGEGAAENGGRREAAAGRNLSHLHIGKNVTDDTPFVDVLQRGEVILAPKPVFTHMGK